MINGLDIYYSNVGEGLEPVGNKQKANGLKPISKGKGCIKGKGLKILQ